MRHREAADKMTQIEVLAETLFYHAMSHRAQIEFFSFSLFDREKCIAVAMEFIVQLHYN